MGLSKTMVRLFLATREMKIQALTQERLRRVKGRRKHPNNSQICHAHVIYNRLMACVQCDGGHKLSPDDGDMLQSDSCEGSRVKVRLSIAEVVEGRHVNAQRETNVHVHSEYKTHAQMHTHMRWKNNWHSGH